MTTVPPPAKRLAFFERYLTLWVFLCMVVGVVIGKALPDLTAVLSKWQFGQGSQVNIPIGVLLWLMIFPMMLKVDFSTIGGIARKPKGLMVTLFINWLIKPFSMALLAGSNRRQQKTIPPASSSWLPRLARRWCSCGLT
jgi:ACR3 family arsenite transporter